ncbi:UNVERIFIED_ORG: hypothetical protein J2X79_004384 [Arthrobacter globiformis]|nr:hypothetical protein [Arthrobacter globiformis]
MSKNTGVFPSIPVAGTGQSLVSHAGLNVVTSFVDALGFRGLCEDRLGQFVPSGARHRPGSLLGSLGVMLAAGGEHVTALDILRASPGLFGQVPSNATVSRFFERTVANPELFGYGFETLTRELRARAWDAAGNRNPALRETPGHPLIIDLDATLVTSHSDKEKVAGTRIRAVTGSPRLSPVSITARPTAPGKSSLSCCARATRAPTAPMTTSTCSKPPPPNWPASFHDAEGRLDGKRILVRTDSAGASRKFLWYLHAAGAQFSVSYPVPAAKAHMIDWINDKKNWQPALDQHGTERTDAWVINATDIIPLADYPPGTSIFLRAEPLHPGAQPTLLDLDGHRITAFLTNSPRWHGPFLDARHRARGRCENRIKTLKNTGLGKLPFFDFAANQAWANIAALASNLVSWLQLTALPDCHQARVWDIKRWRYRLFATAGKIITRARCRQLLVPDVAPERALIARILEAVTELRHRRLVPT